MCHINEKKGCFNLPQCMCQLAPHTGLVETLGQPPKKSIYFEKLLLIQYFYDWFMCPKYMWLDMPDALCCRLSLFRVFFKIKKTVSTSPGLPYSAIMSRPMNTGNAGTGVTTIIRLLSVVSLFLIHFESPVLYHRSILPHSSILPQL